MLTLLCLCALGSAVQLHQVPDPGEVADERVTAFCKGMFACVEGPEAAVMSMIMANTVHCPDADRDTSDPWGVPSNPEPAGHTDGCLTLNYTIEKDISSCYPTLSLFTDNREDHESHWKDCDPCATCPFAEAVAQATTITTTLTTLLPPENSTTVTAPPVANATTSAVALAPDPDDLQVDDDDEDTEE